MVIDTISHLSLDKKSGKVLGAGLTKGSEDITSDGYHIKAGKMPTLFYLNVEEVNRKRDNRTQKRNAKLLKRVGALLNQQKSSAMSCTQTKDSTTRNDN